MGATAQKLTREEIGRRLARLGPHQLTPEVLAAARRLYGSRPVTVRDPEGPRRDPEQRRRYAGDPARYFREILGATLTSDQEAALAVIEAQDRVLLPSGNNVGKTYLLAGYAIYRFDAIAAMPNADLGLEEQGALILLPGPDHDTIFSTIYTTMLELARRAEARGFPMPGDRSERSVLWRVRPRWQVEAFSPAQSVGQEVTHSASGRHHRNQVAIVEEGQGVPEPTWRGTEGMCSAAGNKIISAFNPTEPRGPAFQRARSKGYVVRHLSALDHPNVRQRTLVIPDAIDFRLIDTRVVNECRDMGSPEVRAPDTRELEFLYALPPDENTPERGGRSDGVPGHPDGIVRVYRPLNRFAGQVLGQWPRAGSNTLFDASALDAAMERWRARPSPRAMPDVVGVDPAREGRDTSCVAPRWGENAEVLLRAFKEAEKATGDKRAELLADLRAQRRSYVGELWTLPKGDGVDTAQLLWRKWPMTTYVADEAGVGASLFDHMNRVLGATITGLSFGGSASEPTPGESWSENVRTQLYVRAALLVAAGLTDVPDDASLREELLAHSTAIRYRVVTERNPYGQDTKARKTSLLLIPKDKVKEAIGRSPDRADAWVLAVNGDPAPKKRKIEAW